MPSFKSEDTNRVIDLIALELGEVHFIEKDASDEKKDLRQEFFLATTLAQEMAGLAQKVVLIPKGLDSEAANDFVLKYNSGWRIVENQDRKGRIVIEEDPKFKEYSIVVEEEVVDKNGKIHPGYLISKSIRSGSALIDDERLISEEPDLYLEVTIIDNYDFLSNLLYHSNVDKDNIDNVLVRAEAPRIYKKLDELTPNQIKRLRQYGYEGPKTEVLNIRYAKPEELGAG